MTRDYGLLFGPLAGLVLLLGIVGLGALVPGYSQIHQTVSEIGEVDSPMRIPFTVMLCTVAVCILIFAFGIRRVSIDAEHSTLAAYITACSAISAAGVGIFSFPHPLHNVFGMSELIVYQAPLFLALAWRNDACARGLVNFSWVMLVMVWIAIGLNMSSLLRSSELWVQLKPVYGIVQRSLFAAWFVWSAGAGLMLCRLSAANSKNLTPT